MQRITLELDNEELEMIKKIKQYHDKDIGITVSLDDLIKEIINSHYVMLQLEERV
ncbi:hypothetical protein R4Z09_16025 [Niallia oryzisoli]|uniref:Uncharacterized protein n=1 Tax=Niallia oryzisoli TaxID=1737571 RepID=A0ABZ2C8U6_9BACI